MGPLIGNQSNRKQSDDNINRNATKSIEPTKQVPEEGLCVYPKRTPTEILNGLTSQARLEYPPLSYE